MTSTGARERVSTREVAAAPDAHVEITTRASNLRVRGHDEAVVRVRVVQSDVEIDQVVELESSAGRVHVRDVQRGSFRLGPLFLRLGVAPDLEIDVPRGARLAVRTVSGSVEGTGLVAEGHWATTSGSLRLDVAGTPVSAESTSGDVLVRAPDGGVVGARSVSGNVAIIAPRFESVTIVTTSGDVTVSGQLAADGPHEITTVSGDVRIATASEVRVETRTVTGDVSASVAHRADGGRGGRTIVVGTGRVPVSVRTISGDVDLRPPEPLSSGWTAADGPRPVTAPQAASGDDHDEREHGRLEILRSLERGEVDVDEATRRLAALDAAPDATDGADA